MKTTKYIATGLCALALTLSSCDDYLDVNDDPNQAPDAPIENVMTAAMVSVMMDHSAEDARLAGIWTQQFTGSDRQYSGYDVYNISAAEFDWGKYYYGTIEQCNIIIEKADAVGNNLNSGIAKVLQAHSFGMMASLYGDIPFSEANQFPAIENPKFDSQTDVYAGVQALLDEAIDNLQNSTGNPIGADLFFDGDASKWLQVANTLKARFYMHTKEYGNVLAVAANGITSSADNWETSHGSAYNQDLNAYNAFGVQDRAGYLTAQGAYLPSILDPSSADYRGNAKTDETDRFAFLYNAAGDDLNYSGMWAPTASFPLVTAVENHLIMAEVNARNGADLVAIGNLNDARAELNAQFGAGTYDDYVLTDFIAGGVGDNGQANANLNLLYEIMEEKYISLVGQIEVFNDVRRTNNFIGLTPKAGTALPQRYIYPADEINANTNAPAAVGIFVETPVNL